MLVHYPLNLLRIITFPKHSKGLVSRKSRAISPPKCICHIQKGYTSQMSNRGAEAPASCAMAGETEVGTFTPTITTDPGNLPAPQASQVPHARPGTRALPTPRATTTTQTSSRTTMISTATPTLISTRAGTGLIEWGLRPCMT